MALGNEAMMLDRSDIIQLIDIEAIQDNLGVWHNNEIKRAIYCNVSSVTSAEWHSANQEGLKAAYVFTVFGPDYNGEELVEYNGARYSVIRTYRLKNDNIELHCGTKKGTQK